MIDTHAHMDDEKIFSRIEEVLENSLQQGIKQIVTVGYDLSSSKNGVAISNQYENIYAVIGVHPHDAKTYNQEVEDEFFKLAENKKVVALGEIGLDFHYNYSPQEVQIEVFLKQLQLAEKLGLPVVIHTRNAWETTLKILYDNKELLNNGGIVHCFEAENIENAQDVLQLGFFVGLGGSITFASREKLREVVKQIPLEKIVLETDCPYLAPAPHRGKVNEPKYVALIAEKLAQIKEVSFEEVAKITTQNAKKVYKI